jgi:hypothetical protein
MIGTLRRKARQVYSDPVLRRWLMERALRRVQGPPSFYEGCPTYLANAPTLQPHPFPVPQGYGTISDTVTSGALDLALPGENLHIEVCDTPAIFSRHFSDTETLLALHRFAWLPLTKPAVNPGWVHTLWNQWRGQFGTPSGTWPWHPYTAAERVINLIDYIMQSGFPGDPNETIIVLARHGPAIAGQLEYYGDHYTSNHLSNNGRGLYRLGLFLGWPECADIGATILLNEAPRIFMRSGILREGSSHYHVLLTRNYADAWLAARRHGRPEEEALRDIVARALSVIPALTLPGGMPLVGDISPDCPPEFLDGLSDGGSDWLAQRSDDERHALQQLCATVPPAEREALAADGWVRADHAPWAALWHCAPEGWSQMPGHGHQDCGSFELHHDGQPVIIDPGRGRYGDDGDAARYRSAETHSGLTIDGTDPYPTNRPYYDNGFRRKTCGPPPSMDSFDNGVSLTFEGLSRLNSVGQVCRRWSFDTDRVVLNDTVAGTRTTTVERRLITHHDVTSDGTTARIRAGNHQFEITSDDGIMELRPATRWTAYGRGETATEIRIHTQAALNWSSQLQIRAL